MSVSAPAGAERRSAADGEEERNRKTRLRPMAAFRWGSGSSSAPPGSVRRCLAAMADEEEDVPVSGGRGSRFPLAGTLRPTSQRRGGRGRAAGRAGSERGPRVLTAASALLCPSSLKRTRKMPAGAWTAGRARGRGCSPKNVSRAAAAAPAQRWRVPRCRAHRGLNDHVLPPDKHS